MQLPAVPGTPASRWVHAAPAPGAAMLQAPHQYLQQADMGPLLIEHHHASPSQFSAHQHIMQSPSSGMAGGPSPAGVFLGSFGVPAVGVSAQSPYQQVKGGRRQWVNRVPRPPQPHKLHPAALLHRDYLQEYREKYGPLSTEVGPPVLLDLGWPMAMPVAHHLHPAVVAAPPSSSPQPSSLQQLPQQQAQDGAGICACPGTKRLQQGGKPCKTCGRRGALILTGGGSVRGGTVRGAGTKVRPALLLPPTPGSSTSPGGGTGAPTPTISPMRLRPTPTTPQDEINAQAHADPYDLMRRSRLALKDKKGSLRARSKSLSPSRARLSFPPSLPSGSSPPPPADRRRLSGLAAPSTPCTDEWVSASDDDSPTPSKSILSCDVNAYELISKYLRPQHVVSDESSDELSDNAIDVEDEWGVAPPPKSYGTPTTIPRISKTRSVTINGQKVATAGAKVEPKTEPGEVRSLDYHSDDEALRAPTPKPPPRRRRVKKSIIKSILKKSSVTSMEELSPLSLHIPTYQEFKQRKKQVQFQEGKPSPAQGNSSSSSELAAAGIRPEDSNFSEGGVSLLPPSPPPLPQLPPPPLPERSERDCASVESRGASSSVLEELRSVRSCTSEPEDHQGVDSGDQKEQGTPQAPESAARDNTRDDQAASQGTVVEPSAALLKAANKRRELNAPANKTAASKHSGGSRARREGGSIVHVRGDHGKLFLDTMRLRLTAHHPRATFDPQGRTFSPPRPREPPPPPPSPQREATSPANHVEVMNNLNASIVTVNSDSSPPCCDVTSSDFNTALLLRHVNSRRGNSSSDIGSSSSSNESEYNTLRINIGQDSNLATVLTVSGEQSAESIEHQDQINGNYNHYEAVDILIPHICAKGQVTIGDTSIVEKVENTRRVARHSSISSGPPDLPCVATSIQVGGIYDGTSSRRSWCGSSSSGSESAYMSTSVISVSGAVLSERPRVQEEEEARIYEEPANCSSVNPAPDTPPPNPKDAVQVYCASSVASRADSTLTDDDQSSYCGGARGSPRKFYVTVEDEDEEDEMLDEEEEYFDEEIEGHYEMIRDPIYEEIVPPTGQRDAPIEAKSIFEGASKYDILNYLVGAKERGISCGSLSPPGSVMLGPPVRERGALLELPGPAAGEARPAGSRGSSGASSCGSAASAEESQTVPSSPGRLLLAGIQSPRPLPAGPNKSRRSSAEIERNDSGVGSETSQSSRSRWLQQARRPCGSLTEHQQDLLCEDCDQTVEPQVTDSGVVFAPLVCRKCGKRRSERREIISELLETELKYGRDLRIMRDEFYRPMLVAGLLSQEHLDTIFLNVPELLEVSLSLSERLQDAVDIALDQGDEDLLTVDAGRILLEDCPRMLAAFQTYCTKQGSASLLLSSLEKEKELLKIFLRVSQMENAVLRRMNLNSFLMVPVQRVTRYPLLLSRLYKATPAHHEARERLRQAQQKIEAHLEHMNAEANKDASSTRLWRRISIISVPYNRRSSAEPDLSVRLKKLALEVLGWNREGASFAMEGRLLFTQPTDSNWRKGGRTIKLSHLHALLVTRGDRNSSSSPASTTRQQTFPRASGLAEASLLLLKDKGGRCTLLREPLSLEKCLICGELPELEECFEVQEIPTRDTFLFKAETIELTRAWFRSLQFHAQGLGGWRRRRNALANIMMNGMQPRS